MVDALPLVIVFPELLTTWAAEVLVQSSRGRSWSVQGITINDSSFEDEYRTGVLTYSSTVRRLGDNQNQRTLTNFTVVFRFQDIHYDNRTVERYLLMTTNAQ